MYAGPERKDFPENFANMKFLLLEPAERLYFFPRFGTGPKRWIMSEVVSPVRTHPFLRGVFAGNAFPNVSPSPHSNRRR